MYSIRVESRFSSSHFLKDYEGDCANLHGHNWKVAVEVRGMEVGRNGMLVDFTRVQAKLDEIADEFDHTVINNHHYFKSNDISPTAETIARYFYSRLKNQFHPHRIHRVDVFETDDYIASYLPDER